MSSSEDLIQQAPSPIKVIRLLPQRISPELAERILDPLPAIRVLRDQPSSRERTRQQACLAADEEAAGREEEVGRYVTEDGGFSECRHIR